MSEYRDLLASPEFQSHVAPPTLEQLRRIFTALKRDARERVVGQDHLIGVGVNTALLNKHMLVEGVPGEAKTTFVNTLATFLGLNFRRIQFRPDMLPADIAGSRLLVIDSKGKSRLTYRRGPLYSRFIIADEINRGPSKVQATMLETMAERQISRIDQAKPDLPYAEEEIAELARLRGLGLTTCYGLDLPDPTLHRDVFQMVVATQNPIEQEGTYPLAEASVDRFTNYIVVRNPDLEHYWQIVRRNLFPPPAPPFPVDLDPIPTRLKTISLLTRVRRELIESEQGYVQRLHAERPGLWDRVALIIKLTHYRVDDDGYDDPTGGPALGRPDQEKLRRLIRRCREDGRITGLGEMITSPLWAHPERGSSPRGLIDWVQAAAAEAFLPAADFEDGEPAAHLTRKHFRETAVDVLRHRVSLSPQARADRVDSVELIKLLTDALLKDEPNEETDDVRPLF
jgi:MoxR-like ATPase